MAACPDYFINRTHPWASGPSFFIGVEEVVAPVEDLVDPDTAVVQPLPLPLVDKEETSRAARQVGDIGARIAMRDTGKSDQQEKQSQYPEGMPPLIMGKMR